SSVGSTRGTGCETTPVHHAARRRGRVAARGARAADGDASRSDALSAKSALSVHNKRSGTCAVAVCYFPRRFLKIGSNFLRPTICELPVPLAQRLSSTLHSNLNVAEGHLIEAPLSARTIFTIYCDIVISRRYWLNTEMNGGKSLEPTI